MLRTGRYSENGSDLADASLTLLLARLVCYRDNASSGLGPDMSVGRELRT